MTIFTNGKFISDREIAHLLHREDQIMCDFGAWHWMLSQAAFKTHNINYYGKIITLKRGDFPTSYRELAKIFKWSTSRVQRFLKNLKMGDLINTSTDTGFSIISICNYDKIQSFKEPSDTPKNTGTSTNQSTRMTTNRTKETKDNVIPIVHASRDNTLACTIEKLPRWKQLLLLDIETVKFNHWIAPLNYSNGFIECPTEQITNWVKGNYGCQIKNAF